MTYRTAWCSLVGLAFALSALAQTERPNSWLAGRELDRKRQLALSVNWTNTPLRKQLISLSQRQRIGVFLDRRIDPDQSVDLSVRQLTWDQLLWRTAERCNAAVCRIGSIDYIGPPATCARLPILVETAHRQARKNRHAADVSWTSPKPWRIERYSQPRQLIRDLASQNGFQVLEANRIPHDIWPEWDLPRTTLVERFALVLAGFDLWFEVSTDGTTCRIIDMPTLDQARIRVPHVTGARAVADELSARYPDISIRVSANALTVTGSPTELLHVRRELVRRQQAVRGETTQQINVTASRGSILATIAKQSNRTLQFAPAIRKILDEMVTLKMEGVDEGQIIAEVLKGTGLEYELTADRLVIQRVK